MSSSTCDGPCSAGFFCPAGSRWPTEKICGTIINYCPAGSGAAKVAQPGYYTYCPASSPQGPKCAPATREGELPCPAGYFCSDGGIVSVFWETKDLKSYMCRYVSSANPRIATANAKVVEAEDGAKVLPLLGDASKGEIHTLFGTGVTADDNGNTAAPFAKFNITSVICEDDNKVYPVDTFTLKNLTITVGNVTTDDGVSLHANKAGIDVSRLLKIQC